MKIFFMFIVALLLISSHALSPYIGYRMALSKSGLEQYYFESFNETLFELKNKPIPDINGTIVILGIKGELNLTNIKISDFKLNPNIKSYKLEEHNKLTAKYMDFVVSMNLSFNYHLHLWADLSGTGKFNVKLLDTSLIQNFGYQWCMSLLATEIKRTVLEISGIAGTFGLKKYAQKIIDSHHESNELISMLAGKLYEQLGKRYRSITELSPFSDKTKHIPIRIENNLMSLESDSDKIVFNYRTFVYEKDGPYRRNLYKMHNIPVLKDSYSAQICLPINLLTSVYEVYGKARGHMRLIDFRNFSLSGRLDELSRIIPRIDAHYQRNDKLIIGCKANSANDIVLIKNETDKNLSALIPINCAFTAKESGETALTVNFVIKSQIEIGSEPINNNFLGISAKLYKPEIVSFKIEHSIGIVEEPYMLQAILLEIAKYLAKYSLSPEPFAMKVPFYPKSLTSQEITDYQICVKYF